MHFVGFSENLQSVYHFLFHNAEIDFYKDVIVENVKKTAYYYT